MTEIKRRRKRKKKRTGLKVTLAIFAILLLAITVYGVVLYKQIKDTATEIHEPIQDRPHSDKRGEPVAFEKQVPFSVLVLGVDERAGDKGRSDTILVLTVNPEKQSTKMVSIPRDTYTEMVGRGFKDKLNHAYAFGGIKMAMDSVEQLLQIPIDYVMQVNMESFKDIVDAVGGVTVNNTLAFDSFDKGTIHLNGNDALAYVRMRKKDPRGDFGRQDRQKQVLQAVLREGASVNSLLNYQPLFDAIGKNIRTNISFDEMVSIQKNYRDAAKKMDQLMFQKGNGQMMQGIWYYMMSEEELQQITTELKQHLSMKE